MRNLAVREDDPRLELKWPQDKVLEYLRDYIDAYGEDELTQAAFNPSLAKWHERPDLRERYYQGNPRKGGKSWPALNTIKKRFGSFNGARAALGLPPNKTGGGPRRDNGHAPDRTIKDHLIVLPAKKSRDALKRADRAEARALKAEARVRKLEAEVEQLQAALARVGVTNTDFGV